MFDVVIIFEVVVIFEVIFLIFGHPIFSTVTGTVASPLVEVNQRFICLVV